MALDYLGDTLPAGYRAWSCDTCTAGCNYEAMQWCALVRAEHPDAACGFERDQPESNGGCFGFMVKEQVPAAGVARSALHDKLHPAGAGLCLDAGTTSR